MTVGIVGGTGGEGFGLALRLASAGEPVVIGSRDHTRAEMAAERARDLLGAGVEVSGTANADAVQGVDVVIVTVPFAGQAAIYKDIGPHLASGAIVCDTTSPLATAVGGRASWVLTPWQGSAAEQAEALLPEGIRLAAGFHSVSAEVLNDLGRALEGDVLLAGDDEAKAAVGALVERIPNLRWVDAGPLSSARLTERLTALLVNVNRRYKVKDAGIRIVGLPGRD